MTWVGLGFAVLGLRLFWGLGLALLLLPERRRGLAWLLAPFAGAFLQMTVVWIAARVGVGSASTYAWPSTLLPVGLLIAAVRRSGWHAFGREVQALRKFWGVYAVMGLALVVLVWPASQRSVEPTTVSLGGCDAASYAGGAEALKHFRASDDLGFLGQSDIFRGLPEVGFYQWWLNFDHFGPAALLAMTASLVDRDVFKIVTIDAATYWAMMIPVFFAVARQGFGLGARAATVAIGCLAVSPISQYVVHHGMLGQLLAGGAMGLLWWASAGLLKNPRSRHAWSYASWAVVGNGVLMGSYTFFLPFVYAPICFYAGLRCLPRRGIGRSAVTAGRWRVALGWSQWLGLAGLISAAIYFPRVASLPYVYSDLGGTAYGWAIARINVAGLFGVFADWQLTPSHSGVTWLVALGLVGAWGWCARLGDWDREWRLTMAALAVGTLLVYAGFLQGAAGDGVQRSYQAFKIFAVAAPLLFLCFGGGLRLLDSGSKAGRTVGLLLGVVLFSANGASTAQIAGRIMQSGLVVDSMLGGVRRVTAHPAVTSVNILYPAVWPRLWSSAFLLSQRQYFSEATYEGRAPTPLLGEWDLSYATIIAVSAEPADMVWLNPMHHLSRHEEAIKVTGRFDQNWYPEETVHHHRWRWNRGSGDVELTNTTDGDLDVTLELFGARAAPGPLQCRINQTVIFEGQCTDKPGLVLRQPVRLPPGVTRLMITTGTEGGFEDQAGRKLGFALYRLKVHLPSD